MTFDETSHEHKFINKVNHQLFLTRG